MWRPFFEPTHHHHLNNIPKYIISKLLVVLKKILRRRRGTLRHEFLFTYCDWYIIAHIASRRPEIERWFPSSVFAIRLVDVSYEVIFYHLKGAPCIPLSPSTLPLRTYTSSLSTQSKTINPRHEQALHIMRGALRASLEPFASEKNRDFRELDLTVPPWSQDTIQSPRYTECKGRYGTLYI